MYLSALVDPSQLSKENMSFKVFLARVVVAERARWDSGTEGGAQGKIHPKVNPHPSLYGFILVPSS